MTQDIQLDKQLRIISAMQRTDSSQTASSSPLTATVGQATEDLLTHFRSQRPVRTGSLIVTLFGDSIAPRGGNLWLGSLIGYFAELQISQRLVRTAAYRLVQDGVLENKAVGRRSYYSLTPSGRRQFEVAAARIYGNPHKHWDGTWSLVFIGSVNVGQRPDLRKALAWLGYGAFGTDLLAHPLANPAALQQCLLEGGCSNQVVVMDAQAAAQDRGLQSQVRSAWDLDALGVRYRDYLDRFEPVQLALRDQGSLEPKLALTIRTLLIHEYRKVLLRDPGLPAALLPDDWPGHRAYALTQGLYRRLLTAAESALNQHFECETGALAPPGEALQERFSSDAGAPAP